jgi:Thioredoxin-like [2Fe-2S] ferredoxin
MHKSVVGGTLLTVLLFIVGEFTVSGFLKFSTRNKEIRHLRVYKTVASERKTSTSIQAYSATSISEQESKFKILTCMSTACCRKRTALGMESIETFGAMFARAASTRVQVEESPCLGSCKLAPCVGVEHEDYVGCVALEGMTNEEFVSKAYVILPLEQSFA